MDTANLLKFDIVKSCEDKRDYKGYILPNKLKVVLVSDTTTEKAAASVDVHIGHLSDPVDLPGLAHFCEHMLFLGTEKYPSENAYTQFLNEHGGHSNAYTSAEHTAYFFDVRAECLREALDLFAQFFLGPLFNEDATDREVNAIESENQKNLLNDYWRINQLDHSTSKPDHPYNRFGTGNLLTLKTRPEQKNINPREELLKFHNDFYSANIMCFTIVGKESIEELEAMAIPLFGKVENKDITIKEYSQHPFGEDQLQLQLNIVPVKDSKNLYLTFPLPDLEKHFLSKPDHYVAHLIGHEGDGSLLSVLKKKGWINLLSAGSNKGGKGFMFFIVNMELTDDGFDHVDEIILHVFQYINLLREKGPQEWIFNEIKALDDMTFRYKDKEKPYSLATMISHSLQVYPIEDVLCGPYKLTIFDPELINSLLDHLKPSKLRVKLTSKTFEGTTDSIEEWYNTAYSSHKYSKEKIKSWEECGLSSELHLPTPNEFITTDFKIKSKNTDEAGDDVPDLIMDNELFRVWYKQDKRFLLPKACLFFEFSSPLTSSHPRNCALVDIFLHLLQDSLTEFSYDAELAGISYRTELNMHGIQLRVKGYNSKQSVLLSKIVERMVNLDINPERFDSIKEKISRKLKNFEAEQPHTHAIFYLSYLLSEHAWDKSEILDSLKCITMDKLKQFIPEYLGQMHIEALIAGNVKKEEAVEIAEMVAKIMQENSNTQPLLPVQRIRHREIQLPDGCFYVFERKHEVQNNSCIEVYYQTEMQNTRSNVLLELFAQLISEKCFDQLRTQEQLGYIVFSGIRRANGVQGLRFIIQSEKVPSMLDERIEDFLKSSKELVENLSDKEFSNNIEALVIKKLEEPKKLSDECHKYWVEITSKQYNFRRPNIEAEDLKKITKKDILDFYDKLLGPGASKRHKIAVYILGNGLKSTRVDIEDNKAAPQFITDVVDFKSCLPLFPLIQPYNGLRFDCKTKAKL
eukprot:gene7262-8072_t